MVRQGGGKTRLAMGLFAKVYAFNASSEEVVAGRDLSKPLRGRESSSDTILVSQESPSYQLSG
jgi:hypothetical protein